MLNVLPRFAAGDVLDGGLRHAERLSECSRVPASGCVDASDEPSANVSDLPSRQFGRVMRLATGACSPVVASLFAHVSHVVGLSSEPQMVGVDAWRVVAAMKDMQAVRDRADVYRVRESMGAFAIEHAISSCAPSPVPFPACGRLCNGEALRETFHRRPTRAHRAAAIRRSVSALAQVVAVTQAAGCDWGLTRLGRAVLFHARMIAHIPVPRPANQTTVMGV